ncbi:MAG: phosphatase PAP2 family protein [Candidatus Rokubacteria bacterium]|nr:phosphatase PAP2 family protein [Candidatus Rokubacteria bacterium]
MKRLDPLARRRALWLAVALAALFVVMAWLVGGPLVTALDHAARRLIREGRMLALERPMRTISTLGSGDVLFPVLFACSAVLWWRGRRALALWLPAAGVATSATLALAKWVVDAPRPTLRAYGFPSGHVYGATVFVIVGVYLLWAFAAPRRVQWTARVAGAAFVTAVGYSRIFVNAHWLSDVVGGLVAGCAFALGVVLLLDRRLER